MKDISAYFKGLEKKRVAVLGIGVSNTPLIELLCKKGAKVTAFDRREEAELYEAMGRLNGLPVEFSLGEDYLDTLDHEIIFKTPGIRPDIEPLLRAAGKGSLITSEMEVFFELCPCKIIAVTGSDGKTTTTSLIAAMLKEEGYTCHLGGNIGRPLLPEIELIKKDDVAVVELSSFQLQTMKKSPHTAVITNVTPNHLDYHRSMEEYVGAKGNILHFQSKEDRAVLNFDNAVTRAMGEEVKGELVWFSHGGASEGVFEKEGQIFINMGGKCQKVLGPGNIILPGRHNVENYMAAIGAVWGMVGTEAIQKVARTFSGVPHRIEKVAQIGGVSFYNDSIASSPARTAAGLCSFDQKVILIAGGYDKKIPFDSLAPHICKRVKTLVLTGKTAFKIREAVEHCPLYKEASDMEIIMCSTFDGAVNTAAGEAEQGDIVLLSPACASFDMFKNFEERGERFRSIVLSLKEKEGSR